MRNLRFELTKTSHIWYYTTQRNYIWASFVDMIQSRCQATAVVRTVSMPGNEKMPV